MTLLNPENLTYVELDEIGADVWEAIILEPSSDAAVDRLLATYDVDRGVLTSDVWRVLSRAMEALGLAGADTFAASPGGRVSAADRYLDLMTMSLCGLPRTAGSAGGTAEPSATGQGDGRVAFHPGRRAHGRDVPMNDPGVFSMIGVARMRNVRALCERAILDGVPGDFIECGVWRGGACIMMRAVIAAHDVVDRQVWVADSFVGLPAVPDDCHPADESWRNMAGRIEVAQQQVEANFASFGLHDDQVRFLPGWFNESLPGAPVEQVAVLRLDGDLYSSTIHALTHLYPKVSVGGYVIIDDYNFKSCRQAVIDYRAAHGVTAELHQIDWAGVWWQKEAAEAS
jgi:O-methyltransferase/8-demethyl-8-(2,3-dimethoxy-alpha-L-rhamnosyl)tetracenomycin-C 4'-O-methyltransferase